MNNKGLYLYCLADGSAVESGGGSQEEDLQEKGVAGGGVFAFMAKGFAAVVQECEGPFSSDDKETVSQWVLTHQKIVELAWKKYGTVVPCSFDTIVLPKDGKTARENLTAWFGQEGPDLRKKLERLVGKAEYGVQILWDPTIVASKITRNDRQIKNLEEEIESKGGGTAYLLRQKMESVLKRRLEIAADAYFKEFYKKIEGLVGEVRVEKVRKESAPRQMLLNLSCLLPKGETSRLGDELDRIAKVNGFYVRFIGPWPPYSFV